MSRKQQASRWPGAWAAGLTLAALGAWTVRLVLAEPGMTPRSDGPVPVKGAAAPADHAQPQELPPLPAHVSPGPAASAAPAAPAALPTPSPATASLEDLDAALAVLPAGGGEPAKRLPLPVPSEEAQGGPVRPGFLARPLESRPEPTTEPPSFIDTVGGLYRAPVDAPNGFTGRSGILPEEEQDDPHFVPMPDRWRAGFPEWDRYGKGHPALDDYPYVKGSKCNPFEQNVLKGDYPIIGNNVFLEITGTINALFDQRQTPIATTPFESTANPLSNNFFGNPNQFGPQQNVILSLDLFHGDAAFRQPDWRVKVTPIFNTNQLAVDELAVVNPDVRRGTDRYRSFFAIEEYFVETKLADTSPDFDFVSVRVGSQPFTSDFRGFIFSDVNRAVRLFGTNFSNRDQFNLIYFRQQEKDTNTGLNSFNDRHQQVLIANYYRQDFIWPGYTAQFSVHYNHDDPTFKFDNNSVLVRPDPVGVFHPHTLDVAYLGWAGDGHINRFNIDHAFYWALGYDTLNPIGNQGQDINAQMAAIELSYDRDWIRFRTSFFWASGDNNPNNKHATGFDSILDNPNFAGGDFSYWQRNAIRLFGVNLTQRMSLVPDLRSSKTQGQSNFVNPGLYLANFGFDVDVTPRLRIINNCNFLWFDSTTVLKQYVFADNINQYIGVDLSTGVEYRPRLSNNVIMRGGVSTLIPGTGFKDLFNNTLTTVTPLVAGFMELVLTF